MDEASERAAATYNAAADLFDNPVNSFWDRFGRRTVERLQLRAGERVLDACCGSGASAIPAAQQVGPAGRVLGVDVAERLLDLGRAKARRLGLTNLEFRLGDMRSLGLPDESHDAVVCVFGIFFVPDIAGAVRGLWRLVRPGGRLAVTTWGKNVFEPADTAFWEAVRAERPDLYKGFSPWDQISDPDTLRQALEAAGVRAAEISAESGTHSIQSPDDWWTLVVGTGYRRTVDQLDAAARERVRAANLDFLRERGVRTLEANVLYALATKGRGQI